MTDIRNLRVYEAAEALSDLAEAAADQLDATRAPGLRSQMRRAAESIPANLSEGAGQGTDPQLLRGVNLSIGSTNELGVHLRRARKRAALDPITIHKCESRRLAVSKMLLRLRLAIEERIAHRENEERDRKSKKDKENPPSP